MISSRKKLEDMAELIQNYNFEDALQGNAYDGIIFNLPQEAAFSLVGANIYMQLRKKPGLEIAAEFSTENSKIRILSDYSFEFCPQVIELIPDTYQYDILIVFATNRPHTFIGGKWTIYPCITHKKL